VPGSPSFFITQFFYILVYSIMLNLGLVPAYRGQRRRLSYRFSFWLFFSIRHPCLRPEASGDGSSVHKCSEGQSLCLFQGNSCAFADI